MKTLFTVAFLFLVCSFAFGQQNFKPGYIVNLQGDTIRGLVNNKGETKNALTCNYKATDNAEITDYTPTQLKAYGFTDGKMYESKKAIIVKPQLNMVGKFEEAKVEGQPLQNFMKVLVKGKASLFAMLDITGQEHYYLQKDSGAVQEIYHLKAVINDLKTGEPKMHSSKQYVGAFTIAFNDCPSIAPKIQKTEFKESALMELVTAYNTCINPNQKVITTSRPKSSITWGGLIGVSKSSLNIKSENYYLEKGEYSSDPAITGGLFLNISLPRLNERLSLHNALMYNQKHYTTSLDVQPFSYRREHYDVTFNFDYIRLMSMLRYTLPTGTYRPFVGAGLGQAYALKTEQYQQRTVYMEGQDPDVEEVDNEVIKNIRKSERSIIGGIGILRELPSGMQVTAETRYEWANGFSGATGIGTANHNFSVLIGIGF